MLLRSVVLEEIGKQFGGLNSATFCKWVSRNNVAHFFRRAQHHTGLYAEALLNGRLDSFGQLRQIFSSVRKTTFPLCT